MDIERWTKDGRGRGKKAGRGGGMKGNRVGQRIARQRQGGGKERGRRKAEKEKGTVEP